MHPRGFTLIELLVVVAIIGLLASIVFTSVNGARSTGRDAQRVANLQQAVKIISGDFIYGDGSTQFTACTGTTAANHVTTNCTGPGSAGQLAGIRDPSGTTVCTNSSSAVCQFGVWQTNNGNTPTYSDWKVITYLEAGTGPFVIGRACVSSATSSVYQGVGC